MSSKKVAGTCYIKVDGDQLAVTGGVEVPLTDVEREAFKTSAGVHFSETDVIPYVKVECVVPKDFPREKINPVHRYDHYCGACQWQCLRIVGWLPGKPGGV